MISSMDIYRFLLSSVFITRESAQIALDRFILAI